MEILCTLLRRALLYKQWFGNNSPLSAASQGRQDASQIVRGAGQEEGIPNLA